MTRCEDSVRWLIISINTRSCSSSATCDDDNDGAVVFVCGDDGSVEVVVGVVVG